MDLTINGTGMRERDAGASDQLMTQHRTVCDAICARRPEEVRTAMQTHIDFMCSHVERRGEEA